MQLFRKVLNKIVTFRNDFMSYLSFKDQLLYSLYSLFSTLAKITSAGLYRDDYWNSRESGCHRERIHCARAEAASPVGAQGTSLLKKHFHDSKAISHCLEE